MSTFAQPFAAGSRNRDWSDWIGFVFFIGFAALIFVRTPVFGILLLPTIAHELFVAFSFLTRRTARGRLISWPARAAAYGATFALPVFMSLAQQWKPKWLALTPHTIFCTIGFSFWLFGSVFGLWALWSLRRSFSIEPQARDLVTSGPYTIARHPIYLSYVLQYAGILLAHLTLPLTLICIVWFMLMFVRALFEEQVLKVAFPAYEDYRKHVGMFGPSFAHGSCVAQLLDMPTHVESQATFAAVPPEGINCP